MIFEYGVLLNDNWHVLHYEHVFLSERNRYFFTYRWNNDELTNDHNSHVFNRVYRMCFFLQVLSFRRTVFILVWCVTVHSISLLITYEKVLQRTAPGAVNFVGTATDWYLGTNIWKETKTNPKTNSKPMTKSGWYPKFKIYRHSQDSVCALSDINKSLRQENGGIETWNE